MSVVLFYYLVVAAKTISMSVLVIVNVILLLMVVVSIVLRSQRECQMCLIPVFVMVQMIILLGFAEGFDVI